MVQRGNEIRNFSPSGYLNQAVEQTTVGKLWASHDWRQWLKSSVKSKLTWALAFKMRVKPWTVHGEFFRWAFFLREKRIQRQAHAFKWQMRVRGARCARKLFHHGPTSWRGTQDPFLKAWEEEKGTHVIAIKYHFSQKGTKTAEMVHLKSKDIQNETGQQGSSQKW